MEPREGPRQLIVSSQSSVYPTKSVTFASDEDEPPAYVNDVPHRTRDQRSRTRSPWDGNWQTLSGVSPAHLPSSSLGRIGSSRVQTTAAEAPLRPNRRDDPEFGWEDTSPVSQVLLPISANNKLKRMKSSSGNSWKSGKHSWLRNIKSPIGESHACPLLSVLLVC